MFAFCCNTVVCLSLEDSSNVTLSSEIFVHPQINSLRWLVAQSRNALLLLSDEDKKQEKWQKMLRRTKERAAAQYKEAINE